MDHGSPEGQFAAALAAVQAHLPKISAGKTAKAGSYQYKYADLSDILPAVLPVLSKNGLAFTACPTLADGRFVLDYGLHHTSGHSKTGQYPLRDGTPQEIGSQITYARRYAFCALVGIAADEDDDGRAASQQRQSRQTRQADRQQNNAEQAPAEAAEQSASRPPLVDRIKRAGAAVNLTTVDELQGKFGEFTNGANLRFADDKLLTEFAEMLEKLAAGEL